MTGQSAEAHSARTRTVISRRALTLSRAKKLSQKLVAARLLMQPYRRPLFSILCISFVLTLGIFGFLINKVFAATLPPDSLELVTDSITTRAIALDSVTRLTEPFPPNILIPGFPGER